VSLAGRRQNSDVGPRLIRSESGAQLELPVAPSRVIVFLGLGAALPWLLTFLVGSIAIPALSPPSLRREAILGAIAVNLLFLILHILAVMGVWLAFYKLRGAEVVEITPQRFTVRRSALGVSVPMKLRRSAQDVVMVLDTSASPGKGAHPRLEVRAGRSAVRFGAGLSAEQAQEARNLIEAEFTSTEPERVTSSN